MTRFAPKRTKADRRVASSADAPLGIDDFAEAEELQAVVEPS